MKTLRVKVQPPDEDSDSYHVHLPTYMMVPGTEEYIDAEKTKLKSVKVLVPDDEVNDQGKPDKAKIRRKYKGQPRWDREDLLGDV